MMAYPKLGPFLYADVLVMHGKLLVDGQMYKRLFWHVFKKA